MRATVLVPTTVLAQQHYQTFIDRFVDYPIVVEVLSRFRINHHYGRSKIGRAYRGGLDPAIRQ